MNDDTKTRLFVEERLNIAQRIAGYIDVINKNTVADEDYKKAQTIMLSGCYKEFLNSVSQCRNENVDPSWFVQSVVFTVVNMMVEATLVTAGDDPSRINIGMHIANGVISAFPNALDQAMRVENSGPLS